MKLALLISNSKYIENKSFNMINQLCKLNGVIFNVRLLSWESAKRFSMNKRYTWSILKKNVTALYTKLCVIRENTCEFFIGFSKLKFIYLLSRLWQANGHDILRINKWLQYIQLKNKVENNFEKKILQYAANQLFDK